MCEAILSIKEQLAKNRTDVGPICEGYCRLFEKIDKENERIEKSFLSRYIPFGKGYDPFFLTPYEHFQQTGFPPNTPKCVMKLFQMNISYVYRLIKAKNMILTCMSSCTEKKP